MKYCPNCHSETDDEVTFCPVCGTMLDTLSQLIPEYRTEHIPSEIPVLEIPDAKASSYDHTSDFRQEDISETRIPCMCVYLLGPIGIIITLLMAPDSPYARFHIIQALKFTILEVLIAVFSAVFCWTVLIPILGAIALLILMFAKFACFLDVIRSKASLSPILHMIRFLN